MSHGRHLTDVETTVVEVTTDDGAVGYGEVCTLGSNYIEGFAGSVQAGVRALFPLVINCDPLEAGVLTDRMDQAMLGHNPAKAAIDAAYWDLRGKMLGLPVASLLGGVLQSSYPVFFPVTLGPPDEMVDEALAIAARGYRNWQLKLGNDPIGDAERVTAIADALEDKSDFLTSDANRGWSMAQTKRFLAAIGGVDTYIEQPCRSLAELANVRAISDKPVTADESVCSLRDLYSCLALGAADAINLKPARVGGLTKAAQLRDAAQAAGLMLMIDEPMGGTLSVAGIGHLSSTCHPDTFLAASHVTDTHISSEKYGITGGPVIEMGRTSVSDQPGLGVDVDAAMLGEPLFTVEREEVVN